MNETWLALIPNICVRLKHYFRWNEALHFGQSGHSDWRFRWHGANKILPKDWVMAESTTYSVLSLEQTIHDHELCLNLNSVIKTFIWIRNSGNLCVKLGCKQNRSLSYELLGESFMKIWQQLKFLGVCLIGDWFENLDLRFGLSWSVTY